MAKVQDIEDETERLRACVSLILHHITPHANENGASDLTKFIKDQCEIVLP